MGAFGDVHSLVRSEQFHAGLLAGLVAAAAVRGLNAIATIRAKTAPDVRRVVDAVGGSLLAAALLAALLHVTRPGGDVVAVMAFGCVAAAAWCATKRARLPLAAGWLLASVVLAIRLPLHGVVAEASIATLVAICAPLAAWADRTSGDGTVTLLALLVSAAGIWVCVPDTEAARAVLGVLAVGVVAWWPGRRHPLGAPGTVAIVVGLSWVIAYGARGRPGATAGAAACIGALALAPAVAWLVTRKGRTPAPLLVVAPVHVAVVAAASRWAGLMKSPGPSALAALAVLACGALLLVVGSGRLSRSASPEPSAWSSRTAGSTTVEPRR